MCRAHLGEVQKHRDEFQQLGARVVIVSQARPEVLSAYLGAQPLAFPVLADPERVVYAAFGLERTSWGTMARPDVILRYLPLLLRGWLPRPIQKGEDVLQLGGDFLLDAEGSLVYAYRSAEPTDRPPATALLDAIRKLASPATGPAARARSQ